MKAIIITFLVSTIILSTSFTNTHKFYMSVTDINYNEKNQSLEVVIQTFTDDFEEALESETTENIRLGTKKEHTETDKYIQNYLNKNFKISIDESPKEYILLGKEIELNDTYCYLEFKDIENFKSLSITNKILISVFESQKNIINIKKGKKTKALTLRGSKTTGSVNFQ